MFKSRTVIIIGVFVFLSTTSSVWAWGPATHVKLATDLLAHLALLPVGVAAILRRHGRDYLFGNIAADVILAKRLSRIRQFCHHWETGFAMYDDAPSNRGRAFALGYLSHLAADTVGHNKFVPRQMTLSRTTMAFGHLYWELRADATIGSHYWTQLKTVLDDAFAEHQASLSSKLTETLLPFSVNWRLFYRMNRFVGRRSLQWVMDRWHTASRWPLSDQLMREYRAECFDRMVDILTHLRDSSVLHDDPNGNAALAYTRVHRRQLRQMARSGLIAPHILYEAAVGHAPVNASAAFLPRQHEL